MKTRKHICFECSKTFTRATILKDHLRAHEGTRPYNCDTCGRAFTRRWDLKSHAQLHEQSAPHYDCDGCGARFHRKRDVLRHQERKKGSRCRTRQLMSPQIDQDVQAAGALAGLKHAPRDHDRSRSGFILVNDTKYALCPLNLPGNVWINLDLGSGGHRPMPPRCQHQIWPSLLSLRNHLRIVHGMYSLCTACKTYIQARGGPSDRSSSVAPECHAEACSSVDMPIESFPESPFPMFTVELPSEEEKSRRSVWVALLPWDPMKPPKLSDDPKGTTPRPSIIDLDRDTVSTGQVTVQRSPTPARAWPGLETGPEIDWKAWESVLGGLAHSSNSNFEVATQPMLPINGTLSETTTLPPLSAEERNDQFQYYAALQQSILPNARAVAREPDPSGHDGFSNPRPDLLKVIVDVTNYLRGIPLGELHPQISFCQWKILQLFVARLDEVPKADFRVMLVDTDALRNKYADHYGYVRVTKFGRSDDTFDQLLRPLLDWRRAGDTFPITSRWFVEFKHVIKRSHPIYNRRLGEVCPSHKYLEVLRPHDACVTALRDNTSRDEDRLSFSMGDQIVLHSHETGSIWRGYCFRTSQTASFYQGDCA